MQNHDAMDIETEDQADNVPIKESLPYYYNNIFPAESMYRWLSYGQDSYFSHREWSFTKDSIYTRYNSYSSCKEFHDALKNKCPDKLDIGAVFETKPSDHQKVQVFEPRAKELVFDIDATDYKDVFVATEKTDFITSLTWPIMCATVQVIDYLLRNDFGFRHIMWVFSGRRGVHCWVCDPRAKKLSNAARSAVAEYLQVVTGGEKKLKLPLQLHPSLDKVYKDILRPLFENYFVQEQQILNRPNHVNRMIELLPKNGQEIAQEVWKTNSLDSKTKWNDFNAKYQKQYPNWDPLQDIIFTYLYPRLDINVSKQLNHLLKSPFAVHPSTGRICIPFLASEARNFRPEEVPTIASVLREINKKVKGNTFGSQDVKTSTSLAKSYEIFDKFIDELIKENENWLSEENK